MKTSLQRILTTVALATALVYGFATTPACGNDKTTDESNTTYECPMHCQLPGKNVPYTQQGPGRCPVCGMELTPQAPATGR